METHVTDGNHNSQLALETVRFVILLLRWDTVVGLQLAGNNLIDRVHRLRVVVALVVGVPSLDLIAPDHVCFRKRRRPLEEGRLGSVLRVHCVQTRVQRRRLSRKRQVLRANRQRLGLRVHDRLLAAIHGDVAKQRGDEVGQALVNDVQSLRDESPLRINGPTQHVRARMRQLRNPYSSGNAIQAHSTSSRMRKSPPPNCNRRYVNTRSLSSRVRNRRWR